MKRTNILLIPDLNEIKEIASFKRISEFKHILVSRLKIRNKTMGDKLN